MANQYLHKGEIIDYTPSGAAVVAGQIIKIGDIVAVAPRPIADGVKGSVYIEGVHQLAKTAAQAWTAGAKLYLDESEATITTTSAGNVFCGYAAEDAAADATEGPVILARPGS